MIPGFVVFSGLSENFIVGTNSEFAYAAAYSITQGPVNDDYNPLFLYGGSGLGKTHLLSAIKNEIQMEYPNFNIIYTSGEHFTNELINCLRTKTNYAFHEKYRNCDVLLVDDIQFIAGKVSTQEEFFHTFNALYEGRKQIILTSDRQPHEINKLEERLRKILGDNSIEIEEQRLLTECAVWADKIAIDEELVRLRSHFCGFSDILASGEPAGRKLDFLVQEINREINTTGSKCNNAEIAERVVTVKCELEKIREQIQNIE